MNAVETRPRSGIQLWPLFRCPYCGRPAHWDRPRESADAILQCTGCGYRFLQHEGVTTLLTTAEKEIYLPFLRHYRRVRKQEGWHAGTQAPQVFPYPPAGSAHYDLWRRRAASYERLLAVLARRGQRALDILDLGAGNCWLARRLAEQGHRVEALDINIDVGDGLGSIGEPGGIHFGRVAAPMDHLPYLQSQFDVVVAAASIHYARDLEGVVREAARVLRRGGQVILLDTPIYNSAAAGRAVTERILAAQPRLFGSDGRGTTGPAFIEAAALRLAFQQAGLTYREVAVHGVPRATAGTVRRTVRALLPGTERARMPVVVGARPC